MIVEFIRKKSFEGGAGTFQGIFEEFLKSKSHKLVYFGQNVPWIYNQNLVQRPVQKTLFLQTQHRFLKEPLLARQVNRIQSERTPRALAS